MRRQTRQAYGEAFFEADIKAAQEKRVRLFFAAGGAYGAPGTTGALVSNYMHMFCNTHPILSLMVAHPMHPLSRLERVMLLVCNMSWVFLVVTLLERWQAQCASDCAMGICADNNGSVCAASSCVPGADMRTSGAEACDAIMPTWVPSLIAAGLTAPYGMIVGAVATCSWARGFHRRIHICIERVGGLSVLLVAVLSALWVALGVVFGILAAGTDLDHMPIAYAPAPGFTPGLQLTDFDAYEDAPQSPTAGDMMATPAVSPTPSQGLLWSPVEQVTAFTTTFGGQATLELKPRAGQAAGQAAAYLSSSISNGFTHVNNFYRGPKSAWGGGR
ncbi:hypothetical protein JKP88DRAFT_250856 [Tribonema minus]|uniref:Uncharacterized protein n=1 Tax=Tribonema minus TaxID=303371 RepID=A0A835ZDA6_9STRA|nr:hypothetical protein JKP88DRAFT_250856 [Tribonema minus]